MVCQRRLTECRHKNELLWAIFYILWNMLSNLNHCQQSYATRWHMYTHVAFRHILFYRKNILQIRPGQCPNIKKVSFLYRKKYTKIKPQQQMFFLFINTNSRSFFWPWPNIWGLDLLFPVLTIKVFHRDMFYSSRIQTVRSDTVSIWIRPKKK